MVIMGKKIEGWNRTTHVAGAIILSIVLISGCSAPKDAAKDALAAEVKTVKVAPVAKQQIADPDEVVADVVPSSQIDVVLKVGGEVAELVKKRGEFVNEGDVIIRIDQEDALISKQKADLNVTSSASQLAKAKEDLVNNTKKLEQSLKDSEQAYNKMRNDYDLGLVTKHQLEQGETSVTTLRRDLDILKRTNSLAGIEQQYQTAILTQQEAHKHFANHDVKAPISGIITELPVERAMSVNPGFKAAQIQQLNPVKIKADLNEASYKLVAGKKELELYMPGTASKFKGQVNYLADVISSQTKAYALELEVANANSELKPGMRVQILLNEAKDQEVIAVPTSSIVREGGDTFVFVLTGDTVEKRKVELGRLKDIHQEIITGLKIDEQLVISGQHQLKDKEKVQLAKDETQPAQK